MLTDEEFISEKINNNEYFYENLPKEFGYLSSYYTVKGEKSIQDVQKFYEEYFGDILNDKDKLENLFKVINTYMEERKRLFINHGGSINEYKKATGKDVPAIIIMINGFDSFSELYPDYVELLTKYTRECPRFGIYFMITGTGTSSVRYKLSQNFKLVLALELNDKSDYYSLVGKTTFMPSKAVGRGLVHVGEGIYEFQTAHPSRQAESVEFFKKLALELNEKYSHKAPKIPVLPDKVNMKLVSDKINNLNSIPVGIYKDNLETCLYDFKKNFFNLITATDIENTKSFSKELLSIFNGIKKFKTYLFDSTNSITDTYLGITKYTSKYDDVLNSINENIDKIYSEYEASGFDNAVINKYQPMLFVIYDFNNFKSKVTVDLNNIMSNLYTKASKLPIINFIAIDAVDNFKKIEYDTWFKQACSMDNAIWIGEGIANQFTIKLTRSTDRALQAQIGNDFGYSITSGRHRLIKVLTFDSNNLSDENKRIENDVEEL